MRARSEPGGALGGAACAREHAKRTLTRVAVQSRRGTGSTRWPHEPIDGVVGRRTARVDEVSLCPGAVGSGACARPARGATLSAPVLECFRAKWLETVVGAPEYEAVCAAMAVRDDASVVFEVLSPWLACSDVRADGIRRAIAEQVRAAWSMADSDAAVVPGGFEHDTPPSRALPALGWLDVVSGKDGDAQDIRHGLGWSVKPHPLPAPRVVLSGAEGGVALLVLGYTVNPHQSRRLSEVLESDLPSARIVHLLEHQFGGHRCAQVALLGLVIISPPLVEALDPRHGIVDEWLARLDLENPGPEDLATLDAFFAQFGQFPRITRAQERWRRRIPYGRVT